MDWYPLRFRPIYQMRVWGGRQLAAIYGRTLPGNDPIGESWEIVDRPGAVSVVTNGPLAGKDLHDLLELDTPGLLGDAPSHNGRFPLLIKILDARDVLSLQVHPPPDRARDLGGEPKTEFWYFTAADPGAEIMVGLRGGVTRSEFEYRLADGSVADCVHRVRIRGGDAMFLPSGRIHALGAGLLLFEIQENSDTTYRVFDWNRVGLDGRPRQLHVRESLRSIDFSDIEPMPLPSDSRSDGATRVRPLVEAPEFRVELRTAEAGVSHDFALRRCAIVGVVKGRVDVGAGATLATLIPGDFCLIPAALRRGEVRTLEPAEWLVAEPLGKARC
jgi:mannose-6-phosphate isomerase